MNIGWATANIVMLYLTQLLIMSCATTNGSSLQLRQIMYTPLINSKIEPVNNKARITTNPDMDLLRKGYAKIGEIDSKVVMDVCDLRGLNKTEFEVFIKFFGKNSLKSCKHTDENADVVEDVLDETAKRGGDLIRFDVQGNLKLDLTTGRRCVYTGNLYRYGYVYNWSSKSYEMGMTSNPTCMVYEKSRIVYVSLTDKASVWRKDPVLSRLQYNAVSLVIAAEHNDLTKIKNLIVNGSDINQIDIYGQLPLHVAALKGELKVVEYLVGHGAEITRQNNQGTALHCTASGGNLDVVKYLVAHGADVNAPQQGGTDPRIHSTPLAAAAQAGRADIVRYLLHKGAQVDAKSTIGMTPLMEAALAGKKEIVTILLGARADINARTQKMPLDEDGEFLYYMTPLLGAYRAQKDAVAITKMLLLKGANPEVTISEVLDRHGKKNQFTILDLAGTTSATSIFYRRYTKGAKGLATLSGKTVLAPEYDELDSFSDGLARFARFNKKNKLSWGYLSSDGRIKVPLQYDSAGDFTGGVGIVGKQYDEKKGQWRYGMISKNGKIVVPIKYSDISYYHDGLACVAQHRKSEDGKKSNNLYGYIDRNAKVVIPLSFEYARSFKDGVAWVKYQSMEAYINQRGKFITKPGQYVDMAEHFSDGLGKIAVNPPENSNHILYLYGYVGRTGKEVIKPQFPDAKDFSEGLAAAEEIKAIGAVNEALGLFSFVTGGGSRLRKWGYIDKKGDFVIQPIFYDAGSFSEGLAPVQEAGRSRKWGYIDHEGKWVIKPVYESAAAFDKGMAKVSQGGETIFIDRHGNSVDAASILDPWKKYGFKLMILKGMDWVKQAQ